ncbi:hypothetical protein [Bifidobacterium criceti]|uniref:Uncharacterized protein n=1 Tax=Bifidobacterium criceti TaxID=1960969 RepID=A0A2A2EE43_9BIFI|nr:hypothetical protein [Bifidobacterium criceti]PAU67195.1 hypothetical protein B1526_1279 [Bifidobacterium criceti]
MEIAAREHTWPEEAQCMTAAHDRLCAEGRLRPLVVETVMADAKCSHRVGRVKIHQTEGGRTAVSARSWLDGLTRGELILVAAAGLKLHNQAMARAAHYTGTDADSQTEGE